MDLVFEYFYYNYLMYEEGGQNEFVAVKNCAWPLTCIGKMLISHFCENSHRCMNDCHIGLIMMKVMMMNI